MHSEPKHPVSGRGSSHPVSRIVRACIGLALGVAFSASCGEDASVDEGRVGMQCTTCDTCNTYISSCSCDECVDLAYDEVTKTLLKCFEGVFKIIACCPGGGTVTCKDGRRTETCLPEPGNEPRPGGSCEKYRCGC